MGLALEQRFQSLPDELERLQLNGRATDSQFAQNPLPIARAMGRGLAALHAAEVPEGLESRTASEASNALVALGALEPGQAPPAPFARVSVDAIEQTLANIPSATTPVLTHGAPIVANAVLTNSIATFDPAGTDGFDPPERDLAIVIRSIAETFTSEVAATFLEGYVEGGGALPHGPTLDWYGVVAAFR